jgi:hypothetical protein
MAGSICLSAAALRTILCYIDPENTPKIAYDKDEYAKPLIDKIKNAVGDRDGSQSVSISFGYDETELERQFFGVCQIIGDIFTGLGNFGKDKI